MHCLIFYSEIVVREFPSHFGAGICFLFHDKMNRFAEIRKKSIAADWEKFFYQLKEPRGIVVHVGCSCYARLWGDWKM